MNEFIQLVDKFGFRWGIALCAGLLIFRAIKKHAWPYVKTKTNELIDHWKAQQEELTRARTRSFEEMSTFVSAASAKDDKVLESFDLLNRVIREDNKKVLEIMSTLAEKVSEIANGKKEEDG